MDPLVTGALLFIVMFVLMFLGVHVAIALGASSVVFLLYYGGFDAVVATATRTYASITSYTFIAVPLFYLMAQTLVVAALTKDLFEACYNWVGFIRGGVAQATILACGIFAAMCGSSTAGVATFGLSATPEMERLNYPRYIAFGTVAAGATLGILIPPSITFIIYGGLTEQSVGQLFMAGVIPGIILMILLMLLIAILSLVNPAMPKGIAVPWRQKFRSFRAIIPPLIIIFAVLGTIYLGIATPTEAAGVGAVSTLIVAVAMKRLTGGKFVEVLLGTVKVTSMIVFLVTTASVFSYTLTLLKAPQAITTWAVSLIPGPWELIISINILLIIMGCFLDGLSIMVITLPILYPIVVGFGFDPIWYGVLLVINIEIGQLTPPFGMNLFVLKGIRPDVQMGELYKGIVPFVLTLMVGLAIMTAFPQLSLWLPSKMIRMR